MTAATSVVDHELLTERVRQVSAVMRSHAGAIELVDVSPAGVVELRFTGMCQGCPFRPLTMYGTIIPALLAVPGVTDVRAPGARDGAGRGLGAGITRRRLALGPQLLVLSRPNQASAR